MSKQKQKPGITYQCIKLKTKKHFKIQRKEGKLIYGEKMKKNYSVILITNHACKDTAKVNIYGTKRQKLINLEFYMQ